MADHRVSGLEVRRVIDSDERSTVVEAHDPRHGRRLALKIFTSDATIDRSYFQSDVQSLGRLSDHLHIADVLGGGFTADGQPFVAMPLRTTGTAAQRMQRSDQYPVEQILDTGVKLAAALETAHRGGRLHRRINPANVFLDELGSPQLADFSLPSVESAGYATAGNSESMRFVAPEVLGPDDHTPRSDLYALGATMFALLDLAPPDSSQPDGRVRADVPEGLSAVLRSLMAPEPADRPASAADLVTTLQGLQQELGFAVSWAWIGDAPPADAATPAPQPAASDRPPTEAATTPQSPDAVATDETADATSAVAAAPVGASDATAAVAAVPPPAPASPPVPPTPGQSVASAPSYDAPESLAIVGEEAADGRLKMFGAAALAIVLVGLAGWLFTRGGDDPTTIQVADDPGAATAVAVSEEPTAVVQATAVPATAVPTVEPTAVPSATAEPTAAAAAVAVDEDEPEATATAVPEPTATAVPEPTATAVPTAAPTATPQATPTPQASPTPRPTAAPRVSGGLGNLRVGGTVTRADGGGASGTRVSVYSDAGGGVAGALITSGATDLRGRYGFDLARGCYVLRFVAPSGSLMPGGSSSGDRAVCTLPNAGATVNLQLEAPPSGQGTISVSVGYDVDRRAAASVRVELYRANADGSRGGFVSGASTNPGGLTAFNPTVGCYLVLVTAPSGYSFVGAGTTSASPMTCIDVGTQTGVAFWLVQSG